jgi:hypothetical protein
MYLQHHDPTDVPVPPSRVLCARADLITDSDSDTATNKSIVNNYTVVRAMDGRPTLSLSFVPAPPAEPVDSQPAVLHTPTTTVRVTVIVCSAVGGAVFVAVILGLIYAIRIRRRARRILGRMNVLGPGASPKGHSWKTALLYCIVLSRVCSPFYVEFVPTSPSEPPQISPDELLQHDRLRIDPPAASDQMGHVSPLGTPIVTSQTRIEDPDESMSASRIHTTIAAPPTTVRRSILLPNPWSSTRSSPVIIAWLNPASRSRGYPAA